MCIAPIRVFVGEGQYVSTRALPVCATVSLQVPPYTEDSLAEESSEELAGTAGCAGPDGEPDALHVELQSKQAQVGCAAVSLPCTQPSS